MRALSRAAAGWMACLLPGRRAARGGVGIIVALAFPVLILIGALSVDQSYFYFRNLLLHQTVEASALAAAANLSSFYTSGNQSSSGVLTAAQRFAGMNMSSTRYGTVVPSSNVVLGNWNGSTSTFTSLTASGGTSPNAVQVTGYNTVANGNPISLFFGGLYGKPTIDVTTTVVAGFGTGQAFNTIIINDLSQSFAASIPNQQAADSAILDCVSSNSGSASKVGITAFDGHATILQPMVQASTNLPAIQSVISSLNSCGNYGMPSCSGSNIAAALYSSIQQFNSPVFTNQKRNVIIITDGVPNADPITYTTADGIYPAPSASSPICTSNCTSANLWTMAQDQAANAIAAGINVSTIYYSGDTGSGQQASYAAALASLVGGTGVAMVAPTQSQITATYAGFCATMTTALKAVQ